MHNKHDNGASDNEKEQNARAANKDMITTPSKVVFKIFFQTNFGMTEILFC